MPRLSQSAVDGRPRAIYTFQMASKFPEEPLGVGESAKAFCLEDDEKNNRSMEDALASGPLVLVFYRGDW